MKLDLKKPELLKGFLNLFVFGFLFTILKFIEIRFRNLMTYVFKGHGKIVIVYMVKLNVSILNRLRIMLFL